MKLIPASNTGINAVVDRLKEVFNLAGYLAPNGLEALRGTLSSLVENSNELTDAKVLERLAALEARQRNPFV